jgi:hypothetical protein
MARKLNEAGPGAKQHAAEKHPLRDHVAGRHAGKATHEQPRNPKTGRFVKAR